MKSMYQQRPENLTNARQPESQSGVGHVVLFKAYQEKLQKDLEETRRAILNIQQEAASSPDHEVPVQRLNSNQDQADSDLQPALQTVTYPKTDQSTKQSTVKPVKNLLRIFGESESKNDPNRIFQQRQKAKKAA